MGFLFNNLVSYIPFSDKILTSTSSYERIEGDENKSKPKISRKEEKNRIRIANSMARAIEQKKLSPDLEQTVKRMKISALENLARQDYEENKYLLDQISKTLFIASFLTPTPVLSAGLIVAHAKNTYDYSLATPETEKGQNLLNAMTTELAIAGLKSIALDKGKENTEALKEVGSVILNTASLLYEANSSEKIQNQATSIFGALKKIVFNSTSNIEN